MSAPNLGSNAAKRISCPSCDANNYVGGTHCWQCGKPLARSAGQEPVSALSASVPQPSGMGPVVRDPAPPTSYSGTAPSYMDPPIIPASSARGMQPIILPGEHVDPDLAPKAAAALGLIFPIVALPAGMIFLMLDDARKVKLGWIMIWWSIGGSIIGFILTMLSLAPLMGAFHGFSPHAGGANPLSQLQSPDLSGQ